MKRFLIATVLLLAGLTAANAQKGFGVRAGMNFGTTNVKEINVGSAASYQLGVAYNLDLPFGLSIQPALQYNVKGANLGVDTGILDKELTTEKLSVGYLELMASVQWGLDLIAIRPFLDVSPFVGYAINGKFGDVKDLWGEGGINRLEYGIGIGAGLDIWKFQAICRYTWNLGNLMNTVDAVEDGFNMIEKYKTLKNANFGGVTVSLAYFF